MKNFLAIDITTAKVTASVGSVASDGFVLTELCSFANAPVSLMGRKYWDILRIFQNIVEALKLVAAKGLKIESIGIDAVGFDFCCFGSDGLMLSNPRAFVGFTDRAFVSNYYARVPKTALYRVSASQDLPYKTVFQIDAMQRAGSSALSSADRLLFISDALIYMLTGVMVTESTAAGSSALVNVSTGGLDPKALMTLGLSPQNFGAFVSPGMVVGRLSDQMQKMTGLPGVPVVTVAGYELASAVAAAPIAEGAAFVYTGHDAAVGIESRTPLMDSAAQAANISNACGASGNFIVHKLTGGTRLLRKCYEEWGEKFSQRDARDMVVSAKHMRSIFDPDSEAFADPVQIVRLIKLVCESTAQRPPETKAEVLKCLLASVANRHVEVLKSITSVARQSVEELVVLGPNPCGGILCQLLAVVGGFKVQAGPHNAATIGNVMIQAMAAGEIMSFSEARSLSAKAFPLTTYEPKG